MKKIILILMISVGLFGQGNIINFNAPAPTSTTSINTQVVGNLGTATYYYWVIARFPIGQGSNPSFSQVINAPNTLSSGNKVTISWLPVSSATSYDVIRTSSATLPSSCTCSVATGLTTTTVDDTGGALGVYTFAPASNATGMIRLDNISGATAQFIVSPPIGGGAGSVTNIATSAPLTGGPITTTGTVGITKSDATHDGYLSSTDWNTFNNKSVFVGSGAPATLAFSATPTINLADVSSKSPILIAVGPMTANVTSVLFTSVSNGARFGIKWTQDAVGGRTVSYGGSATYTCPVLGDANGWTKQWFVVENDGSIVGDGCEDSSSPGTSGQIDIYQSDGSTSPKSLSGGATVDNNGVVTLNTSSGGSGGGTTPGYTGNQIFSGGQVVWDTGYTYSVSASSYSINGVSYTSPLSSVTLAASDLTNPRIDMIGIDDTGAVFSITGTPAVNPSEPTVDPASQIALAFVYVAATSTQPSDVATTLVYDEDAGAPTEFNTTSSGAGWTLNSTNNPYHGTKDIEATSVASSAYVQFAWTSTLTVSNYNNLIFYVRSKAIWGKKVLNIGLYNTGVAVGSLIRFADGQFGFSSSITSAYQQIVIPINLFAALGSSFNQIRFTVSGTGSGIGFYLDYAQLQSGNTSLITNTFLTNAGTWNATANYAVNQVVTYQNVGYIALVSNTNSAPTNTNTHWQQLASTPTKDIVISFDGGGSALSGTITRCRQVSYSGTIKEATIVADQNGSGTFKVLAVAYGSYTGPASAVDISNGGEALAAAAKLQDSTLTGWSTTLNANTVVCGQISAPATITWAEMTLKVLVN